MTRSPESVLATSSAATLTLSDQHATILLTTHQPQDSGSDTTEQSLIKLTVVPFHRHVFQTSNDGGQASEKIVSFLSDYDFVLSSESGAEYSYYDAFPKKGLRAFLSRLFPGGGRGPTYAGAFKVELISPASERQIQRAMPKPPMVMIDETPELYEKVTKPYIQSIVESGSLSWIENVVTGKKERERLLLDKDDYVLNVDTKWRSHPDANTVPRSEWYDHESVNDLYCLAIVKDGSIASLRDLRAQHLPMLQSILNEGPAAIEKVYGVKRNQLRVFVHYQPQFYHFHVHFTRLENDIGCQVERGHLLSDIIQNLEINRGFYLKRRITFKLPTNDQLYLKIKAHQEENI
jgi:m7GpppX diphosphatase